MLTPYKILQGVRSHYNTDINTWYKGALLIFFTFVMASLRMALLKIWNI